MLGRFFIEALDLLCAAGPLSALVFAKLSRCSWLLREPKHDSYAAHLDPDLSRAALGAAGLCRPTPGDCPQRDPS